MSTSVHNLPDWRFCVAPMMDWTDRHDRFFLRLISRHVRLYTEMVTSGAVLHGDRERLLGFHDSEHPLALQLGGSDAAELAQCARIAREHGYDEINLNVGCPSDRVQNGSFGACLMAAPQRVAECVAAMRAAVDIPVTVKNRIGIDDMPPWEGLSGFVESVAEAGGCQVFIVHARKAWLQGLSPRQNRDVPPLDHAMVYRLKREYPHLRVVLNGGITDLDQAGEHLRHVDGVMLGRAVYHNPWLLADVDRRFYGAAPMTRTRHDIVNGILPYVENELARGTRLASMTRHLLGLFQGMPGAKRFRRHLSEHAHRPGAGVEVLEQALALVPEDFCHSGRQIPDQGTILETVAGH